MKGLFETVVNEDASNKDLFYEKNYILVLIRPANLRLFLGARILINDFIDYPIGKLTINFHRVAKISDHEYRTA